MNFRNIKTIIAREYLTKVKKKSFLLITFLGPVFFAAMCILPSLIMFFAEDKGKQVAIIDNSGIVMDKFVDNESVSYLDYTGRQVDSLKNNLDELGLDALVVVSEIDTLSRNVAVSAYSTKPMSVDMKEGISSRIEDAVEDYRLSLYDIDGLKQIMSEVYGDAECNRGKVQQGCGSAGVISQGYRAYVRKNHWRGLRCPHSVPSLGCAHSCDSGWSVRFRRL